MRKESRTIHFEHLGKPYRIELEKENEGYPDLCGVSLVSRARLFHEDQRIGFCKFSTYRRKKNEAYVEIGEIFTSMDAFSADHAENFDRMLLAGDFTFEILYNDYAAIVADSIRIDHPHRGSGLWKILYAHTLKLATEKLRDTPENFYFEVFPLDYANHPELRADHPNSKAKRKELETERDKLARLYAYELDASLIPDKKGKVIMSASVDHVLAFLDEKPKRTSTIRMR